MMLLVMAYFVFAQAYNTTQVVGIFRAGGDTRFGLILDVSTTVSYTHRSCTVWTAMSSAS